MPQILFFAFFFFLCALPLPKAWAAEDAETVALIEQTVAAHGLENRAYPLETLHRLSAEKNLSAEERNELEAKLDVSLLRLAHDLHGDSIDLAAFYDGWNVNRHPADLPALVAAARAQDRLAALYDQLAPQRAPYRFLMEALQRYRALRQQGGWHGVTPGPTLQPGDRNDRVVQTRARLAAEGYLPAAAPDDPDAALFDPALQAAVIAYQTRNGLAPDGAVGGKTQEALNVPLAARIEQIRANMERWRHIPETDMPPRYVAVNIPAYSVKVVENGQTIYQGAAVVGRIDRPTPFIKSRIVNVMINPSWHVPEKLARLDILPKLKRDRFYLEKQGIVIAGRDEDPSGTTIDWKQVSAKAFPYTLTQRPGDINSLGRLKFNFANSFAVYMHGTPHQELFDKAERSFSSGCVRLKEPERVAELLLADNKTPADESWTLARIQEEIADGHSRSIPLRQPPPIYFAYWSVFEGPDGSVNFRKDIYGYDAELMKKIKEFQEDSTQPGPP